MEGETVLTTISPWCPPRRVHFYLNLFPAHNTVSRSQTSWTLSKQRMARGSQDSEHTPVIVFGSLIAEYETNKWRVFRPKSTVHSFVLQIKSAAKGSAVSLPWRCGDLCRDLPLRPILKPPPPRSVPFWHTKSNWFAPWLAPSHTLLDNKECTWASGELSLCTSPVYNN